MSISVDRVTKMYGAQKALNEVSLTISGGEIVGFLGPNGAGKSTIMKIITGYLPASSGKVWINGQPVVGEDTEIRKSIGYLPEHNPLYPEMYVKEYLYFVAGIYKLPDRKKRIAEMVELTGFTIEQHKKIGALSKGYRQRVGLAQALIHNPNVLILDEPTTGLDPNQLEEIRSLIRQISRDKTVLLSTHIMQEVEALCQRVIIINQGVIVADDNVKNLKSGTLKGNQQVVVEFAEEVATDELLKIPGIGTIEKHGARTYLLSSKGEKDIRPLIFHFATIHQLTLLTLHEKQQRLENVFQELTK